MTSRKIVAFSNSHNVVGGGLTGFVDALVKVLQGFDVSIFTSGKIWDGSSIVCGQVHNGYEYPLSLLTINGLAAASILFRLVLPEEVVTGIPACFVVTDLSVETGHVDEKTLADRCKVIDQKLKFFLKLWAPHTHGLKEIFLPYNGKAYETLSKSECEEKASGGIFGVRTSQTGYNGIILATLMTEFLTLRGVEINEKHHVESLDSFRRSHPSCTVTVADGVSTGRDEAANVYQRGLSLMLRHPDIPGVKPETVFVVEGPDGGMMEAVNVRPGFVKTYIPSDLCSRINATPITIRQGDITPTPLTRPSAVVAHVRGQRISDQGRYLFPALAAYVPVGFSAHTLAQHSPPRSQTLQSRPVIPAEVTETVTFSVNDKATHVILSKMQAMFGVRYPNADQVREMVDLFQPLRDYAASQFSTPERKEAFLIRCAAFAKERHLPKEMAFI